MRPSQRRYFIILAVLFSGLQLSGCSVVFRNKGNFSLLTVFDLFPFHPYAHQFGPGFPGIGSSVGGDLPKSTIGDRSGNTYMIGDTSGSLAGAFSGGSDVWVSKVGPTGNIIWIKQLTDTYSPLILASNGSDYGRGIAVDLSGNVYPLLFSTAAFAGPNPTALADVIVGKMDSSGNLLWIKQFNTAYSGLITSSAANDYPKGITVDSSGNVFVTGFTSGSLAETNEGNTDGFVAKIAPNGTLLWIHQLVTAYSGLIIDASPDMTSVAVTTDSSGNVFVSGDGVGNFVATGAGNSDMYLLKIDPAGTLLWGKQFVPSYSAQITSAGGGETCSSATADSNGNIIITGFTNFTMAEAYQGGQDSFVAKVDPSGTLLWIHQLVPSYSPLISDATGVEDTRGIMTDAAGNIYFSGTASGSFITASGGNHDLFIGKMDPSGNLAWIKQVTTALDPGVILDASGEEYGYGVATDLAGNSTLAGQTDGALLGPNGGFTDVVILNFDKDGNLN